MEDQEFRPSYPFLEPVPEPLIPPAPTAPVDLQAESMNARHGVTCAVCKLDMPTYGTAAYSVMSCGHSLHFKCGSRLSALPDTHVGGPSICAHCKEKTYTTEKVPEFEASAEFCLSLLEKLHRDKFPRLDVERILSVDRTPQEVGEMLGKKTGLSPLSGIVSLFKKSDGQQEEDEEEDACPRGVRFVEEMVKAKRDLDTVFLGKRFALPHIYSAGATTMEDLFALGFNPSIHLKQNAYAAVCPVYFLVKYYDMKAANHMRGISPRTLSGLNLSAHQLLVLGITAPLLIEQGMTGAELVSFRIYPSNWEKYLSLEPTHLLLLGFKTREDFFENARWAKNVQTTKRGRRLMQDTLCLAGK